MYVSSSDSQTSASGRAVVLTIPGGDPGVETTVRYIGRFVQQAVRTPEINRLAIQILQESGVPEHNPKAEAKAIFNWVRKHIRFVSESEETLRPVQEILRVQAGDCDDINGILLPSLLLSVGIPVRLVTVAVEPESPKDRNIAWYQFNAVVPDGYATGFTNPLILDRDGGGYSGVKP